MASIKISSARNSFSPNIVQSIKDLVKSHINTYFSNSLAQEQDIVNIVAGLIYFESTYNSRAVGPTVSPTYTNSTGEYYNSSVIQNIFKQGTNLQQAFVKQGLNAVGLMQVMGYNFIKKASKSGKCEIERLRPDLVGTLCVDAGTDLFAIILGPDNISKAILAGLVILEGKFNNVKKVGAYWQVSGDKQGRSFTSQISGAVGAYLGLGKADINGTTPEGYSASIVGGDAYRIANSSGPNTYQAAPKSAIITAGGPTTNGSDKSQISTPGCA